MVAIGLQAAVPRPPLLGIGLTYFPDLFPVEIGHATAYHEGVPDADHCPADQEAVAERYVMESLPDADAAVFEEHLLTCGACQAAVEEADVYVRAMQAAAEQLRNGNPEGGELG